MRRSLRRSQVAIGLALSCVLVACAPLGQAPGSSPSPSPTQVGLVSLPLLESAPVASAPPEAVVAESPPPTEPALTAQVNVVNYCFCSGPRGQAQVKVKPQITATAGSAVPIADANFRLVVDASTTDGWSGNTSGPIPELMTLDDGSVVLLVPPNRDNWSERLDGSWTFATHWNQTSLTAGATFLDPAVKAGDLVFYVPTPGDGTVHIRGLVLMQDGVIDGWAPVDEWTGDANPNDF